MFALEVKKNQIQIINKEPMTSGSQNVYVVQFNLSSEWDYLEKVAVFATDVGPDGPIEEVVYRQLLDENNQCIIPWEVVEKHSLTVFVGLLGMANGNIILPTIWANIGNVLLGVTDGVASPDPPTPDIYQQILIKLNEIQGTSALDTFTNKTFTNIHDFDEITIPGTVIMVSSSINTKETNLVFTKEIVNVEFLENQNGSILRIVSVSNSGYDFNWDENGDFISMTAMPLPVGEKGDPGTTFTPSVSESGELSWVNDGGLTNPAPVNIKGQKGDSGPQGPAGADSTVPGPKGEPGNDGKSSYQIAVDNGFAGTETEWLDSLKGEQGSAGKNATINGENTLTIVAGENVTIGQQDGKLTISSTGGGSAGEAYSTEETRVGTWIDGKPIYRKVFTGITSGGKGANKVVAHISDISETISIGGILISTSDYSIPIGSHIAAGFVDVQKGNVIISALTASAENCKAFMVVEYTKTTDAATVNLMSQSEILTSEVDVPSTMSVDGVDYDLSFAPGVSYASATSAIDKK